MSIHPVLVMSLLMLMSLGMSGCATGLNGETVVGRTGSPMWFKTASPATQTAHFLAICRGYGFKDGTTEMSQCLQTETVSTKGRAQQRISDVEAQQRARRAQKKNNDTNSSNVMRCYSLGSVTRCY
jgi:hypothetical protein